MPAPLAPSLRNPERTRPRRLRRMCHPALASDREELVWVVGKDSPREKQ